MVYEKDAGEGMKKSLRREKEMLWSIVVVVNREKGKVSRRKASLTSMALSFFLSLFLLILSRGKERRCLDTPTQANRISSDGPRSNQQNKLLAGVGFACFSRFPETPKCPCIFLAI